MSIPPGTTFETATMSPPFKSPPTSLPSSIPTQSPVPAAQDSQNQDIRLPVGVLAFLIALVGTLGIVFLGLATAAWWRRRNREAQSRTSKAGAVPWVANGQGYYAQHDDGPAFAAKVRNRDNKGNDMENVDFEMMTGRQGSC